MNCIAPLQHIDQIGIPDFVYRIMLKSSSRQRMTAECFIIRTAKHDIGSTWKSDNCNAVIDPVADNQRPIVRANLRNGNNCRLWPVSKDDSRLVVFRSRHQTSMHNVVPITGRAGAEPRSTDRNYIAGPVRCIGCRPEVEAASLNF